MTLKLKGSETVYTCIQLRDIKLPWACLQNSAQSSQMHIIHSIQAESIHVQLCSFTYGNYLITWYQVILNVKAS